MINEQRFELTCTGLVLELMPLSSITIIKFFNIRLTKKNTRCIIAGKLVSIEAVLTSA